MKAIAALITFAVLGSTASIVGAQSSGLPDQAPANSTLEIPALLGPFMGCWFADDTHEIVESRTPTGTDALPTKTTGGGLFFCWKLGANGAVYFQPPGDGYFPLRDEDRQLGMLSWWSHYNPDPKIDPDSHRVTIEGRSILEYLNNNETEEETVESCLPDGSEMDCIQQTTTNSNHNPWYTEVDHFHMRRVNCGSAPECVAAGVKLKGQ